MSKRTDEFIGHWELQLLAAFSRALARNGVEILSAKPILLDEENKPLTCVLPHMSLHLGTLPSTRRAHDLASELLRIDTNTPNYSGEEWGRLRIRAIDIFIAMKNDLAKFQPAFDFSADELYYAFAPKRMQ